MTLTPTSHGHRHGFDHAHRGHPGYDPAPPGPAPSPPAPADPATPTERLAELRAATERAVEGPAPDATARQHARGKLTARERIDLLLDPGSFVELDRFARHRVAGSDLERSRPYTDGLVSGWGTVEGRTTVVYAHDFRIFGGALGEVFAAKIHKAQDLALRIGAPLVGINDGVGARIQEGVSALDGYGGVFVRNARSSGVVPQISVMLGPCAGGAVYSPALTDFVYTVRGLSNLFITGPEVVRSVLGETVTKDELGGAEVHSVTTGVATFLVEDEAACLADVRYLLGFLPPNNLELPPPRPTADPDDRSCDGLRRVLPDRPTAAYDVRAVLAQVADDGELYELHAAWARNVVCCLAAIGGQVVGLVANQPAVLAGVLDIDASEKAARFVRTCDAFNIPLITFVDVPGFLPGVHQEHGGIIRHGAKLLFAYCEATVPRIQVILRKAYGGAYIVMDSRGVGADLSFAWPTNEVAVMGAEAAVDLLHRKELAAAPDRESRRRDLIEAYRERVGGPFVAAERGMVDAVIDPADTRTVLARSLRMLRPKQEALPARKHGNMPL